MVKNYLTLKPSLGLLLLLFISPVVLGKDYEIQKAKDFLAKNDICQVAYGTTVFMDFEIRHSMSLSKASETYGKATSDYWKSIIGQPKTKNILCIQNLATNIGTINETEGCALSWYNLDNGSYDKIIFMSKRRCENSGVDDLIPSLKQLGETFWNSFGQSESNQPMSFFGIKTFIFLQSKYSQVDSIFKGHLYYPAKTSSQSENEWNKWLTDRENQKLDEIRKQKDAEEQVEKKEKIKADERKIKKKKVESLYE